ncbi:ATP-binding protein [Thiorhodococcus fuscus]|uniref:ATP-binding protein n=1 Tax=Thiorhodococcus fuscus TaxID=527200 RepID=A0ABW4YC88_9GAMM
MNEIAKAAASPTKAFFVRMITRDITLEDCIFDLIDNSIDGAWKTEGSPPMTLEPHEGLSKYDIRIEADPNKFSILDNCGGMSLDQAVEYAFSFGRKIADHADGYSIGVYGIGMKRAVFKLGNKIRIRSTYRDEHGGRHSFAVPIVVSKWIENDEPPWDFDIDDDEPLENDGVEILVEDLNSGASEAFRNPSFLENLKRMIARDYSLHMSGGLKVALNGESIRARPIELRKSDEFSPMRMSYEEQIDASKKVTVEIIGGMAALPYDDNEPPEDRSRDRERISGWYIACNGRIVLAADKTDVSGWGSDDLPSWHGQYTGFLGIVLFTSEDAESLPLTTTKRSVDRTSVVYRRALRPHMRDVSRAWIDYTNWRKQDLAEAKKKEAETRSIPIHQIQAQSSTKLPNLTVKPRQKMANVNYSVSRERMKELARELGNINMSYKDVGLRSFDYMYSDYVGED